MSFFLPQSLSAIPNIRLFIAFRVFFNSRFYYPVFTILFLDFGLTVRQFALLNVVWALTIVIVEVPSGAMADVMGRKRLLVTAGILMVAEMALLCFAPRSNPNILFWFFFANRILSGSAEAAASGADEALAYDSLKNNGRSSDWGLVLEKQMRYRAIGSMTAVIVGAACYDPALITALCRFLGIEIVATQAMTLRFPLFLTLATAVATLYVACRMQESSQGMDDLCPESGSCSQSILSAFRLTFQAGNWIRNTPFALIVIMTGLLFDNVIRMVITLISQYYRMIHLPEATFGIIGALMGAMGLVMPRIARSLTQKSTPRLNMAIIAILTLAGLTGMTFFVPYFGLLPIIVLIAGMQMTTFFLSYYLNNITDSHQRATVLSFKGLSFNLAYGVTGWLYALLLSYLRPGIVAASAHLTPKVIENKIFMASLHWFPWYFVISFFMLLIFAYRQLRNSTEHMTVG